MYIDSHAHLSSEVFLDKEIDDIIKRAQDASVDCIINICTDKKSLERGIEISKKYPFIKNAGSTTPHDVEIEGQELFPLFEAHALNKTFIAVGETGLDYYYEHSNKKVQQEFLIKYIELALKVDLPLIIHCRNAFDDFFSIIDTHFQGKPFLLHCFTGTKEEAFKVLDRGGMISLSGIVTFKKSIELKEIAKQIPLNYLLIETDAPYLAPQEVRGKRNEPMFVPLVAKCLAELKDCSIDEVAFATKANTRRFFKF
jgi:TatD DNase family protein